MLIKVRIIPMSLSTAMRPFGPTAFWMYGEQTRIDRDTIQAIKIAPTISKLLA